MNNFRTINFTITSLCIFLFQNKIFKFPVTSLVRCCSHGGGRKMVFYQRPNSKFSQPKMWYGRRKRIILSATGCQYDPRHGATTPTVSFHIKVNFVMSNLERMHSCFSISYVSSMCFLFWDYIYIFNVLLYNQWGFT